MLKWMGEANFRTPPIRNPSTNFDIMSDILLRPPKSWCAKFGWNRFGRYGSAHAWKKHDFVWIFLLTYRSIPFFVAATGHSFGAILTHNGSNDVFSQPLVPFGGHINIAPYQGSQIPPPKKNNFGAWIVVSSQTHKILKLSYYWKYCSDSNQILQNDKNHYAVFVCGPNTRPTNPRWRTAVILKKNR